VITDTVPSPKMATYAVFVFESTATPDGWSPTFTVAVTR
jgi:hypothetical protein